MSEIIDEFYLENGLFTFILSKKDYEDCEKHSYNSWIRTKEESTYNNGFFGKKEDSIRLGNCGEYTFCRFTGSIPSYHIFMKNGDGGVDLTLNDFKYDVKTTTFNDRFFIRYITEKGIVIPLKSDIYIANRIIEERKDEKYIKLQIMGWQTKSYLMKNKNLAEGPGRNATHININCRFDKLRPITELFNLGLINSNKT